MDIEGVARDFVGHYYSTFDTNRASLGSLYEESSMLSFEGQKFVGGHNIVAKLASLPFDQCKHNISTVDCQPSGFGILVFAIGSLHLSGEEHPLLFSQMFHLVPRAQGSLYVANDMFRLNYG